MKYGYTEEKIIEEIGARIKQEKNINISELSRFYGVSRPTLRGYLGKLPELPSEEKILNLKDLDAMGYGIGERVVITRLARRFTEENEYNNIWFDFNNMTYEYYNLDNEKEVKPLTLDVIEKEFPKWLKNFEQANTPPLRWATLPNCRGTIWTIGYFLKMGIEERTAEKYLRRLCADEELGYMTQPTFDLFKISLEDEFTVRAVMQTKGFYLNVCHPHKGETSAWLQVYDSDFGEMYPGKAYVTVQETLEFFREQKLPAWAIECKRMYDEYVKPEKIKRYIK